MYSLVNVANMLMGFMGKKLLGEVNFDWIENIVDAIKLVLGPILIVVSAAGAIYAIVLGVNMARADSTEKREEAKKRLINVIVGIAVTVALILFFNFLPNILVALGVYTPTTPVT